MTKQLHYLIFVAECTLLFYLSQDAFTTKVKKNNNKLFQILLGVFHMPLP